MIAKLTNHEIVPDSFSPQKKLLDHQGSASSGSFLRSTSYSFQGPELGSVWDPASHLPPSSALPTSPATRAQPYLGGGPPLPGRLAGEEEAGIPYVHRSLEEGM